MRRLPLLIVAVLVLALPSLSCRRRAPGTCADHVDCDPGFDCVEHRCARRAPVGFGASTTAADAGAAIAAPEPVNFPASADDESPPPAPPPPAKTPPARRPSSSPPPAPPSVDSPPPAAGERLPAWQQRRKTF